MQKPLKRGILALVLLGALWATWSVGNGFAIPELDVKRPVVVEMFTSQGCSSCPPADVFLGELRQYPDILPLSFHVDYWDNLGWKDPFADPSYTQRQREYAQRFRSRRIYTPQAVIDGIYDSVGSQKQKVWNYIGKAAKKQPYVPVRFQASGTGLEVLIAGEHQGKQPYDIWLVVFDEAHVTHIGRGENRGRVLQNYHVVKRLEHLGQWQHADEVVTLPSDIKDQEFAVLVQAKHTGRYIGVARYTSEKKER